MAFCFTETTVIENSYLNGNLSFLQFKTLLEIVTFQQDWIALHVTVLSYIDGAGGRVHRIKRGFVAVDIFSVIELEIENTQGRFTILFV